MPDTEVEVKPVVRQFRWNGRTFEDPNPLLTPARAVSVLAAQFPELASAKVEPARLEGNINVHTVKTTGHSLG